MAVSRGTKKTKSASLINFSSIWAKLVGAILGISSILGIGYSIGVFKNNIHCELEKMEMRQDFNEKLQKEIDDCNKMQIEFDRKNIEGLEKFMNKVETLIESKNGKNK